ncbi:MAG: ribosome silencing factor [Acidimicrobiales bacterium]
MSAPAKQVEVATPSSGQHAAVPEGALVAARAADDKLGIATAVRAMGDLLGVTDAFVITSARNTRQVRTIVDEVQRQVKRHLGRGPRAVEGLGDLQWVLIDYGDVIVHVFHEDARAYYDLERLWGDAVRIAWAG